MEVRIVQLLNLILLFLTMNKTAADKPCLKRFYGKYSIACVCNAEYCDEISKIRFMRNDTYIHYVSNRAGERFKKSTGILRKDSEFGRSVFSTVLNIDREQTFQKIYGFGGSFSDSSGININNLGREARRNLLHSYFSDKGIEFNMGRVPIGSADFSDHYYVYNSMPENDLTLSNFSLDENDYKFKIPLIREAFEISSNEILLMATAWSSPSWMRKDEFSGLLKKEYYQLWADYHIRFLQEYKKNNISFWAITTGNEPSVAIISLIIPTSWSPLAWFPKEQGRWLVENFGPTIKKSEFHNLTILGWDDTRTLLTLWMKEIDSVNGAMNYLDGIAVHWYADKVIPPQVIDAYHKTHPDHIIIMNEACITIYNRPFWDTQAVRPGNWERGQHYAMRMIDHFNHWESGWIDWNLALDEKGGPNWTNLSVDPLIIVYADEDEFIKQPTFYILGHFSKFIPRNSVRISSACNKKTFIKHVAFLREDGGVTVVIYNPFITWKRVIIRESGKGDIELKLSPKSINTIVYW